MPPGLARAAAVSWRVLVVAAAVLATVLLAARLRVVLVPTAVAILAACALWPSTRRLRAHGAPPSVAAFFTVAAVVGIVVCSGVLLAQTTADEISGLDVSLEDGVSSAERWLVTGPLQLSERQADSFFGQVKREARGAARRLPGGAMGGATVALEIVAGILLALVLLFFFLKDGDAMWRWARRALPRERRETWDGIAVDIRDVLAGYLRGTALVAAVDAVGIGLGLWLLGVPLVLPLAALTFVGGFVPLVGATAAGIVAVLVALVSSGLLTAVAVLGVVIGVQQIEGHVLQPLVVSRTVQLHPAVVLLSVAAGAVLWGIAGALLAVPVTAALATAVGGLRTEAQAASPVTGDGASAASAPAAPGPAPAAAGPAAGSEAAAGEPGRAAG